VGAGAGAGAGAGFEHANATAAPASKKRNRMFLGVVENQLNLLLCLPGRNDLGDNWLLNAQRSRLSARG
jgi:BioD-like phosphotransacetylase family protein